MNRDSLGGESWMPLAGFNSTLSLFFSLWVSAREPLCDYSPATVSTAGMYYVRAAERDFEALFYKIPITEQEWEISHVAVVSAVASRGNLRLLKHLLRGNLKHHLKHQGFINRDAKTLYIWNWIFSLVLALPLSIIWIRKRSRWSKRKNKQKNTRVWLQRERKRKKGGGDKTLCLFFYFHPPRVHSN